MSAILRGIRSAFRKPGRTAAVAVTLGATIGLALVLLAARDGVEARVDEVRATVGTLIDVTPPTGDQFFVGAGGGTNQEPALVQDDLAFLASAPSVASYALDLRHIASGNQTSLDSGLTPGGNANGGRQLPAGFEPPIPFFGTTDPSRVPTPGGGRGNVVMFGPGGAQREVTDSFRLVAGRTIDGWSEDREAIVGQALADANDLGVGDTFTFGGDVLTVVGLFEADNPFAASGALLPLATLQELANRTGAVSSAAVRVDDVSRVDAVVADLQGRLGDGAEVSPRDESAAAAIAPLREIGRLSSTGALGAAAAAAATLCMTMAIVVRERRREIGTLKAIGAAPRHILRQFAAESATLAAAGLVLATLFALVAGDAVTSWLEHESGGAGLQATITAAALGTTVAGALVLAALGGTVPVLLATRIRPAEVLRGA